MTDIEMALNEAFQAVFGKRFEPKEAKAATGGHEDQFTRPIRREKLVAKLSTKPAINSREWREQVKHKTLDGYGAEDIGIWLDCHSSHVTKEIQRLRAKGDLEKWFSK